MAQHPWVRHPFPVQSSRPRLAENKAGPELSFHSTAGFLQRAPWPFPLGSAFQDFGHVQRDSGVPGTAVSGVTVPKNGHPLSRVSAVLLDSEGLCVWGGGSRAWKRSGLGGCGRPGGSPRGEGWGGGGLLGASGRPGARSSVALRVSLPSTPPARR